MTDTGISRQSDRRTRWRRLLDLLGAPPTRAAIRPTYLVTDGPWGPSGARLTPAQVGNVIDQVLDTAARKD